MYRTDLASRRWSTANTVFTGSIRYRAVDSWKIENYPADRLPYQRSALLIFNDRFIAPYLIQRSIPLYLAAKIGWPAPGDN